MDACLPGSQSKDKRGGGQLPSQVLIKSVAFVVPGGTRRNSMVCARRQIIETFKCPIHIALKHFPRQPPLNTMLPASKYDISYLGGEGGTEGRSLGSRSRIWRLLLRFGE